MTQNELMEKLSYDPATGIFTHLKTHRNIKVGDIAGCVDKSGNGYIKISIGNGKYAKAHRLAFLYMWGYIPTGEVDHIDHNPVNNKWENLRIVTHQTNGKNQKRYSNSSTGITGIRQRKNGKWRARICHKGIQIDLGTYSNIDDAIQARKTAESYYNFHENHGK